MHNEEHGAEDDECWDLLLDYSDLDGWEEVIHQWAQAHKVVN